MSGIKDRLAQFRAPGSPVLAPEQAADGVPSARRDAARLQSSQASRRRRNSSGQPGGEPGDNGDDDPDDTGSEQLEQQESLVRSLRHMGLKAPKPFNPKRDKNFEIWLERVEYHLTVINCPDDNKTSALLLLLDLEAFEAARHLDLTATTSYEDAKQKLKDYFAVTETKEELRERLYLRVQEYSEGIEAYARDIKLIGHKAYPNGDTDLLEMIMVQVFTKGLRDAKTRERVMLHNPKTLTEAAQYARFSEAAVRVAHGPSAASAVPETVNATNFGYPRNSNYQQFNSGYQNRRGGRSNFRREGSESREYSNQDFETSTTDNYDLEEEEQVEQPQRGVIRCYYCDKPGHTVRYCWALQELKRQQQESQYQQQRWNGRTEHTGQHSNSSQRGGGQENRNRNGYSVSTVESRRLYNDGDEQLDPESDTYQPVNSIGLVPANNEVKSSYSATRKLITVPGQVNDEHVLDILIDCGSSVTIINSEFWKQVRDIDTPVVKEQEKFQSLTKNVLKICGVTLLNIKIGGLNVIHPVIIAEGINYKFLLGNDFLIKNNCDIIYSRKIIQFGTQTIPYSSVSSTADQVYFLSSRKFKNTSVTEKLFNNGKIFKNSFALLEQIVFLLFLIFTDEFLNLLLNCKSISILTMCEVFNNLYKISHVLTNICLNFCFI